PGPPGFMTSEPMRSDAGPLAVVRARASSMRSPPGSEWSSGTSSVAHSRPASDASCDVQEVHSSDPVGVAGAVPPRSPDCIVELSSPAEHAAARTSDTRRATSRAGRAGRWRGGSVVRCDTGGRLSTGRRSRTPPSYAAVMSITLIATGGTIASTKGDDGVVTTTRSGGDLVSGLASSDELDVVELPVAGSWNMSGQHALRIARTAVEALERGAE